MNYLFGGVFAARLSALTGRIIPLSNVRVDLVSFASRNHVRLYTGEVYHFVLSPGDVMSRTHGKAEKRGSARSLSTSGFGKLEVVLIKFYMRVLIAVTYIRLISVFGFSDRSEKNKLTGKSPKGRHSLGRNKKRSTYYTPYVW